LRYLPFYVYGLAEPDGFIRYIGQTVDLERRYRRHLQPSNLARHTHKNHWIKKMLRDGQKPIMIELDCVETYEEVIEREIYFIACYRQLIGDALTNSTSGGEGVRDFVQTEEGRAKISQALRGNTHLRGKKFSDETRRRMSEAHKGQRHTEETKAKMRGNKNSLGVRPSAETRALLSERRKGRKMSDETRAKIAESQRQRCARRRAERQQLASSESAS
jgi:predicted GIY-YIG superfamily endonuclease